MRFYPIVFVALASSIAHADGLTSDEMHVIKPSGTADTAVHAAGRIPWCSGPFTGERWNKQRVRLAIASMPSLVPDTNWSQGLEHMCQWADDPTWQRQATYMVQIVMNERGLEQREAVALIGRLLVASAKERADANKEPTDEDRFAFAAQDLQPVAPERGVDTAKVTAIAWCDKAGTITDKWDTGRINRTARGREALPEAAYHLCQRPNDPTWKQKAQLVLQGWMNWTKQTQPEAEASLRARMLGEQAQREELCASLAPKAEVSGKVAAFTNAKHRLFGCHDRQRGEIWQGNTHYMGDRVGDYIDDGEAVESELIRAYWLFGKTRTPKATLPSQTPSDNLGILEYAAVAVDFAALDAKAVDAEVAKAYPGTPLARAIASETVAVLRWRQRMYEAAIDKLVAGDADYAAILRDAPKRGFAQWSAIYATWKPEIERVRAFEATLDSPRPSVAGCTTARIADLHKLIKSYRSTDYHAIHDKLADDAVATLILGAAQRCLEAEKDETGLLQAVYALEHGRAVRGPRSLAYYAVVDALAEALAKRPRMPLELANFSYSNAKSDRPKPDRYLSTTTKGVVSAVKKVRDGVAIAFTKKKVRVPEQSCKETNRIDRITWDGRIEYRQHCWYTGTMITVELGPEPIVVPPHFASGIKAGAYAFILEDGTAAFVKKRAEDTAITTFLGFDL